MAESMTGYGRGEYRSNRYQLGVEIRSVNHRFLEIKLRCPRELYALESELRGELKNQFSRGAMDVMIILERQAGVAGRFVVNEELLGQAAVGFAAVARKLGKEVRFDVGSLAEYREIFRFEAEPDDLAELQEGLRAAFAAACAETKRARVREGESLAVSMTASLESLRLLLEEMEILAPAVTRQLSETLSARATELLRGERLTPERLEQEAALLAMKSDVTEELVRFRGHLERCSAALAHEAPAGRQMDFLIQEMHRELNTAAAKANTFQLSQLAIRGKLELEKIREQVQNMV